MKAIRIQSLRTAAAGSCGRLNLCLDQTGDTQRSANRIKCRRHPAGSLIEDNCKLPEVTAPLFSGNELQIFVDSFSAMLHNSIRFIFFVRLFTSC